MSTVFRMNTGDLQPILQASLLTLTVQLPI